MSYRLIATDIDGTLLDQEGAVTRRATATLARLAERGIPVVLATARPPRRVRPLHAELGLTTPVIAYNGGIAFEPQTGRVLFNHAMELSIARDVLAAIRTAAPAANPGMELADEWYIDRPEPRLQDLFDQGVIADFPFVGPLEEALAATTRPLNKLYFFGSAEVRAAFEAALVERGIRDQVFVTSSSRDFVEILPAGVNKGTALRALAAIMGIPREQLLYLGDEEADVPALQEAGLGIAMGNAPERVKRAAGAVTGANTADGWAEAVDRYVLSA